MATLSGHALPVEALEIVLSCIKAKEWRTLASCFLAREVREVKHLVVVRPSRGARTPFAWKHLVYDDSDHSLDVGRFL